MEIDFKRTLIKNLGKTSFLLVGVNPPNRRFIVQVFSEGDQVKAKSETIICSKIGP